MSRKSLTTEEFVERAKQVHDNNYDYSKVKYVNANTKVCIICKEHGEFWQIPSSHLNGSGCHKCSLKRSKMEDDIESTLKENEITHIAQYRADWLKSKGLLSLDFYLPNCNMAIECQGSQHFTPIDFFGGEKAFKSTLKRDLVKLKLCEKNGVTLLHYVDDSIDVPNEWSHYKVIRNKEDLLKEIYILNKRYDEECKDEKRVIG